MIWESWQVKKCLFSYYVSCTRQGCVVWCFPPPTPMGSHLAVLRVIALGKFGRNLLKFMEKCTKSLQRWECTERWHQADGKRIVDHSTVKSVRTGPFWSLVKASMLCWALLLLSQCRQFLHAPGLRVKMYRRQLHPHHLHFGISLSLLEMQLIFSLMIGFDPRVAPYTEYTDTSAFLKSVYLNMKDLLGN